MSSKSFLKPTGARLVAISAAIGLGLLGLGILSASVLRPSAQPTTSEPAPSPSSDPSSNAVSALGRLEPEGGILKIAAPSSFSGGAGGGSSRVQRLLVKEGDLVEANQSLAVMETYDSLRATANQAQAQLQEAKARLAQVLAGSKQGDVNAQQATVRRSQAEQPKAQAALAKAEAELKKAKWEYGRYRQLFKDGAIAELALRERQLSLETTERQQQQAKQAVEQAKYETEAAEQKLDSVVEVPITDVQPAIAQVQIATANLQKAKADLEKAIVTAPVAGQVLKIHTDPGEVVGNDGLLDLGKTRQMYAVAEVDENYIGKVKVGQKAKVTGYAFSGELSGVVDQVGFQVRKNAVLNSDPVDKTDTRVVEVKIRLEESDPVKNLSNLQVKVVILPTS